MRIHLMRGGAALAVAGFLAAPVQAAELIGNLPSDLTGTTLGTIITGAEARSKAVGFTTPAGVPYEFLSATLIMQFSGDAAEGGKPQIALWSDAAGNPGAELFELTPPAVQGARDFYTFTAATPVQLLPSTTYWLLVNGAAGNTDPASDAFYWNATTTSITPSGAAAFVGYRFSASVTPPTGNSTVFNNFSIDARLIPEPGTAAVAGVLAAGCLARRRRS